MGTRSIRSITGVGSRSCEARCRGASGGRRGTSALATKQATPTIPIVFGLGGDAVKAGLVESFNRPGANATGFTLLTNDLEPKRLGLLHDLLPNAAVVGALVNPKFPPAAGQLITFEKAAQTISQRIAVSRASNDMELEASFKSILDQRVSALFVMSDHTSHAPRSNNCVCGTK